jgi:hypothetical protein
MQARMGLDAHYWINLSSTAGVSIEGALFMATSGVIVLVKQIMAVINSGMGLQDVAANFLRLFPLFFFPLGRLAAVKTAGHFEIRWKQWSLSWGSDSPNLAERESMRIEDRTPKNFHRFLVSSSPLPDVREDWHGR